MWVPALCGLALGLILNVVADWLPQRVLQEQDAFRPAGRRWARWGALLVLSVGLVWYLWTSAAASLPLVEESAAAPSHPSGGAAAPGQSASLSLLVSMMPELAYCSLLMLIATIDLEHRLVPNVLILTGLILAVGFNLLSPQPVAVRLLRDGPGLPGLAMALLGAAVGGGLFLLVALARRNALGAGDVKLAFLIGMLTGFPWVLQALILGILLGGVAAAVLLLFRLRGPKHYIPYAPYLAAGAIATLLYGPQIIQWYARLVGAGG